MSLKQTGKVAGVVAGGLSAVTVVCRAASYHDLPAAAWMTLATLTAGSVLITVVALILDYRRARLEIAASTTESRARAMLEMRRLEMYQDLVTKAAGEPASAARYRELIIADALHLAVEGGEVHPADRTHGHLYGAAEPQTPNRRPGISAN